MLLCFSHCLSSVRLRLFLGRQGKKTGVGFTEKIAELKRVRDVRSWERQLETCLSSGHTQITPCRKAVISWGRRDDEPVTHHTHH